MYGTCGWKKRREENQSPQSNITTTLHHGRNSVPYITKTVRYITTTRDHNKQYITTTIHHLTTTVQYITTTVHHHDNTSPPPPQQQYTTTTIHHHSNTPQQQYIITTIYHHSNTSQGAWWLEIERNPVFSPIKCVPAAMRGYVGNLVCATGAAHARFRSIASYCVKLN